MRIGDVVSHSPVGPGIITDFTERGYPRVNRVAVAWVRLESGEVFDPHRKSICCELCSRIHETGDQDVAMVDGWLQGWDGWECSNCRANSHCAEVES